MLIYHLFVSSSFPQVPAVDFIVNFLMEILSFYSFYTDESQNGSETPELVIIELFNIY